MPGFKQLDNDVEDFLDEEDELEDEDEEDARLDKAEYESNLDHDDRD